MAPYPKTPRNTKKDRPSPLFPLHPRPWFWPPLRPAGPPQTAARPRPRRPAPRVPPNTPAPASPLPGSPSPAPPAVPAPEAGSEGEGEGAGGTGGEAPREGEAS
ncbi:hypothetical protein QBC45DRAFT_432999 [Copromyces sp. CBS 386.78]|nr:hypothetical protein QBC45DRAFT_432999 [Copromyces sp. CBS 386.78]